MSATRASQSAVDDLMGMVASAREDLVSEVEWCGWCEGEIRMMVRKGTGYCSARCFDATLADAVSREADR